MGLVSLKTVHHRAFRRLFYKKQKREIQQQVEHFLNGACALLYRKESVALLQKAKKEGHRVIIQSSSPDFLVHPIAQRLEVEGVASPYFVDDTGRFCSFSVIDGVCKKELLQKLTHEVGQGVTSTVYTDSIADLPLLEAATYPVGVHPDKKLFEIALQRGWAIVI